MDEKFALLGMSLVDGIGSSRLRKLEAVFGTASEAWRRRRDWTRAAGIGEATAAAALKVSERDIERQWRAMEAVGARLVTDADPEYPVGLRHVATPPRFLFVRGRVPADYGMSVAIVGARKAAGPGLDTARALARDLAAVGLVVVSGLARGIDGAAHRGALDAGGRTVAVLGCGLDVAYPREHELLMEDIVADGGIVTEYPMGTPPLPHHFPARNRLIAGLSRGVVLMECGLRSGALYTAHFALECGREVMAVPGDVHRWGSQGPNEWIRQGATLVRHAADVLLALGWTSLPASHAGAGPLAGGADAPRGSGDAAGRLLARLQRSGPLSLDELAVAMDMPVEEAAAALTWLELLGRVRREAGGRFTAYD